MRRAFMLASINPSRCQSPREDQARQRVWTCLAKRGADGSHLGTCLLERVDICAWLLKRLPFRTLPLHTQGAEPFGAVGFLSWGGWGRLSLPLALML